MQIKDCHFTCIKLATDHECTVNLKKIDQAVSELEHQLGLAEMHLGLALRYVPDRLEQCRSTWRKALPISNGLYSLVEDAPSGSCVFRAKSGQNVWFLEPLPQKCHLGLALRYVPKGLERWNFTRKKASRFSTGLYSLVKVQQVEVVFLEQKVVKMCGFRNPCPKCNPNKGLPGLIFGNWARKKLAF